MKKFPPKEKRWFAAFIFVCFTLFLVLGFSLSNASSQESAVIELPNHTQNILIEIQDLKNRVEALELQLGE